MVIDPPKAYNFDTSTGWRIFSPTPGTVSKYDNIHIKWDTVGAATARYNANYAISMSIDGGQSWNIGNNLHETYHKCFPTSNLWSAPERDVNMAPVYKAREIWKRQRAKDRKKVLDSASPEEKAARVKKLADAKEKKRIGDEERSAKQTVAAIDHMIKLGPELIKLKEKIERIVALMSKGGIDRPIIQHDSKLWKIKCANYLLDKFEKHFIECHKRTGK